MNIACKDCRKNLGEILSGSKLHKQIIYLCNECYEKYITYKSLADMKYNSSSGKDSTSMPPGFEDIFKGAWKGTGK